LPHPLRCGECGPGCCRRAFAALLAALFAAFFAALLPHFLSRFGHDLGQ